MGYRSEVVFAVAPPLVDKFLAVTAASEKVRELIKYDEYETKMDEELKKRFLFVFEEDK